ncbi:MAG: virulence protein RhuM/Fic/DOC family protein [Candidatus Omnitrophota bacterium]
MREQTAIQQGNIVLYKDRIEVRLERDTVWLTQEQMASLFGTQRPAMTKHLSNIFSSNELDKRSVCSILEHTARDGKVYKTRFYNLDAIISVGYRVNSAKATRFRIWATNVLKKHLVDGYTINDKRLKTDQIKYRELQKAVALVGNVFQIEELSVETRGIARVIAEYARALDVLDDFDHERLRVPPGSRKEKYRLTYERAREIIESLKRKFGGSALMGQERDQGFKSSIGTVYQTFGKKELYSTVQEKAAHLLYFVTKNHSFVDGNKRIAAAVFICFLEENGLLTRKDGSKRIDDTALVALTLMIAASRPPEKDSMIKVILNLLV